MLPRLPLHEGGTKVDVGTRIEPGRLPEGRQHFAGLDQLAVDEDPPLGVGRGVHPTQLALLLEGIKGLDQWKLLVDLGHDLDEHWIPAVRPGRR